MKSVSIYIPLPGGYIWIKDMKNLIRFGLFESKSVGLLYHYTDYSGLLGILNDNKFDVEKALGEKTLKFSAKKAISFTRDKNFHTKPGQIFYENKRSVRITVDGDLLSNNYRIRSYSSKTSSYDIPKDIKNLQRMESEEIVQGSIKNAKKYILGIEIFWEDFLEDYFRNNLQGHIDTIDSLKDMDQYERYLDEIMEECNKIIEQIRSMSINVKVIHDKKDNSIYRYYDSYRGKVYTKEDVSKIFIDKGIDKDSSDRISEILLSEEDTTRFTNDGVKWGVVNEEYYKTLRELNNKDNALYFKSKGSARSTPYNYISDLYEIARSKNRKIVFYFTGSYAILGSDIQDPNFYKNMDLLFLAKKSTLYLGGNISEFEYVFSKKIPNLDEITINNGIISRRTTFKEIKLIMARVGVRNLDLLDYTYNGIPRKVVIIK